ncbi:MAG: YfhO family protein [Candidatus Palauibacterales bacterium]|nr:YfhO family protein [Candidatus Palauibacterales bacterium]MDP2482649.1 YfhO family protein [Candidatus Palauibacterales bacterium]
MIPRDGLRRTIPAPAAAAGLFVLVAAAFFDRVLFRGEAFFSRDVAPFFYPMKHFLASTVRSGTLPLWDPWVAGGEPFFASLQPGLLYPGSLVLYALPMPAAFDWLIVLHFPLAGAGMALLFRRWGHGWTAAIMGGLVFMLGGFFVSLGNFVNNLQTVAWLPWIFLAWDRVLAGGRIRDLLLFAVLCVVAFLGGEPQMLAVGLLLVFAHGLFAVEKRDLGRGRQMSAFVIAGVLAVAMVSVQLLPFAEYMSASVRSLPIDLEYASARSLGPGGALHLLLPPALHSGAYGFSTRFMASSEVPWILSAYAGCITLALAFVGGLKGRGLRWTAFWLTAGVLSILLALGSHSPLYRALFEWVPPFRPFRYPEKFLLIGAIAVSVFAAQGTDRWLATGHPDDRERGALSRAGIWIPVLLVTVTYVALAVILGTATGFLRAACERWLGEALLCADPAVATGLYAAIARRAAGLTLCLAAVTFLYSSGRLRRSLASVIIVSLAVVDLATAHREVNPSVESDIYVTPPWTADALDELMVPRGDVRYRGSPHHAAMGSIVTVRGAWELSNMFLDYQTMGPNVGQIFGFPMQDGLQGVELISVALTNEAAMRAWSDDPLRFLRAMNVGFYADATASADSIDGLSLAASHPDLPIRVYAVPDPVKRLYLVAAYETREGQAAALHRVLEPDFPLGAAVVLETDPGMRPDPAASGEILSRREGPNRVSARLKASGPMLAVLSDRWYPGWKATVNGDRVPVYRANGVFRAVTVPAGVSDVEFRFAPGSLVLGAAISLVGLLAFTAIWIMAGSRTL